MDFDAIAVEAVKWAALISVIASVINAFTKHYSKHKSIAKALLAVAERLSFLTSSGVKPLAKAPGTSKAPDPIRERIEEIRRKATVPK